MKNIILCCDGTNNHPAYQTNVWRICDAFDSVKGKQVKLYFPGVGSGPLTDKVLGCTLGHGTARTIRTFYQFLLQHYQPGDRIYLFGFSRGAYTVRSFASLLHLLGVPQKSVPAVDHGNCARAVYSAYRSAGIWGARQVSNLKLKKYTKRYKFQPVAVEFVGIWDTVGSVGLPVFRHPYHDVRLLETTRKVAHAIALDEQRVPYRIHAYRSTERVDEVWFAGVHSDIGGGYLQNNEAADIALAWMFTKLPTELIVRKSAVVTEPKLTNPSELKELELHCTKSGCWKLLRQRSRVIPDGAKIHESVYKRVINDEKYGPVAKLSRRSDRFSLKKRRELNRRVIEDSKNNGKPFEIVANEDGRASDTVRKD